MGLSKFRAMLREMRELRRIGALLVGEEIVMACREAAEIKGEGFRIDLRQGVEAIGKEELEGVIEVVKRSQVVVSIQPYRMGRFNKS